MVGSAGALSMIGSICLVPPQSRIQPSPEELRALRSSLMSLVSHCQGVSPSAID